MSQSTSPAGPIVVIGAQGKTGKRVIQLLEGLSIPVIGVSRSTSPRFDWTEPSTWATSIQGARAIYITFQPDLAVPGSDKCIQDFTAIAKANGVNKVVLLSGRGEEEAIACERVVERSGINYTVVRASWFNQNFSEGTFLDAINAGYLSLPVKEVGEPFIDADDIAAVVVAALTNPVHDNKTYEVTGPRLITFRDAIEEISHAIGRPISYEQISVDAYESTLREYQVPDDHIRLILYLMTSVMDGRNASTADGVYKALGRPPRDFSDFVRRAIDNGAWAAV